MRRFHVLLHDDRIEGTSPLYSDPSHNALLGSVEALCIYSAAENASGTTPTLTVQVEESGNQVYWRNKAGTAEINSVTLSTAARTVAVGRDNGSVPSLGFLRLRVQLGGANPKARVRIWVTGRGEQPFD
ncbi:MAG TPA: hypothetical protein VJN18_14940 [Polyangiaceae bacterium]|nr:hypothetical protein [Polyangiaceae bacterium]